MPPNASLSIHLFTHPTMSPKSTSCSAFLLIFIGSHTNLLGDGMRNPTIFAVSQAFKENLSPTCAVNMNTAAPSDMVHAVSAAACYTVKVEAVASTAPPPDFASMAAGILH